MNLSADVLPFLIENCDFSAATWKRLFYKCSELELELAAVVNAGQPFIRAIYSNGPVVFG